MRLLAFILLFLAASSVVAGQRPGPPPWFCHPITACNSNNLCAPLFALPLGFTLLKLPNENRKLAVEGYSGAKRIALLADNFEDAQRLMETDPSATDASIILIRDDTVGDAQSFQVHSVFRRGNGHRFVDENRVLVACSSIQKS